MEHRYGISDKVIAYLTLISGLIISAVAVWYSVAGLVAIFAASAMSIIIMGVALEVSKLVATVWLKWNWHRAPKLIKIYLISAIAILMVITSMGIFGYLSKAHLDQNIMSGDVQARIALVDEKIKVERENIANAQQVIKQMDAAVNGVIATGDREIKLRDGTTRIQSAAERSLQIRRSQAKDRAALTKQVEEAQDRILALQEEIAPVRAEMRKVEAEVGPIKYIAKLIYGDQTDQNMLEKAVTWVIIIIVLVFDPLAVVLLLSSQYSFQWFRQQKQEEERKNELVQEETSSKGTAEETPLPSQPDVGTVDEGSGRESQQDTEPQVADAAVEEENLEVKLEKDTMPEAEERHNETVIIEETIEDEDDEDIHQKDDDIIDQALETEKQAMKAWKHDNPESSLKHYRRLLRKGLIDKLPWEDYMKPKADYVDDAVEEAKKWADENKDSEESKEALDWADEKIKNTYQQNAEQSESTIWQRIQDAKK